MATEILWKLLLAGACLLASAVLAKPGSGSLPPVSELKPEPRLPDPLVMLDGRPVTTGKQWETERRPELKRLFQHYMYGEMPPPPGNTRGTVEREDHEALGGKATLREVTVHFGPEGTPPIHLLEVVPNARKGRVPAFVGLNFCGNHAVLADPQIRIPEGWIYPDYPGVVNNRATAAGRGTQVDVWNIERAVDRGYAVATFYNGDIMPDRPDFSQGVFPHYARPGQPRGPHDWATIAAWAWGLQRAVDYLRADPAIDRKRIAAVGHSRLGKAAILAGAFDERIALAIPLQAGCGGTSPSRGTAGESVKAINDHFPHWFDDTFKQFNDRPELLPFDQHCLIALMAPRPVLLSNAEEDTWANPAGQFEMLKAADPVYRLLGVDGLGAHSMPPSGKLLDSRLGYFIRPGKHSMATVDWQAFLDYAKRWLKPGS